MALPGWPASGAPTRGRDHELPPASVHGGPRRVHRDVPAVRPLPGSATRGRDHCPLPRDGGLDGGKWIDTEPGDWVHVPAGGIHGFKNSSGAPAKMLLHFCPGAPREEYFERVPGMRDTPEEARAAFFLKHDTFWV